MGLTPKVSKMVKKGSLIKVVTYAKRRRDRVYRWHGYPVCMACIVPVVMKQLEVLCQS